MLSHKRILLAYSGRWLPKYWKCRRRSPLAGTSRSWTPWTKRPRHDFVVTTTPTSYIRDLRDGFAVSGHEARGAGSPFPGNSARPCRSAGTVGGRRLRRERGRTPFPRSSRQDHRLEGSRRFDRQYCQMGARTRNSRIFVAGFCQSMGIAKMRSTDGSRTRYRILR